MGIMVSFASTFIDAARCVFAAGIFVVTNLLAYIQFILFHRKASTPLKDDIAKGLGVTETQHRDTRPLSERQIQSQLGPVTSVNAA